MNWARVWTPLNLQRLLVGDLFAQVDQHFGNVDGDRADLVAGAAERGGVRQRGIDLTCRAA